MNDAFVDAYFEGKAEYSDWVESNKENLLTWYGESLDLEDLPEQIKAEILTDDVDVWEMALENHTMNLKFEDVPDAYIEMMYESQTSERNEE